MGTGWCLMRPARFTGRVSAVLIISDMHLEKSTFLAAYGSFIPPYDTQDTLERLEQMVTHYSPRHLILLGDSFHDRHAWTRLDAVLRARIMAINARVERCSWIEGNHDVSLNGHELSFCADQRIEGLLLSHEHQVHASPQIIGHYHPKARLSVRGRKLSGKCFIHTEHLLVMPAFGAYTGGLDIGHEAFRALAAGASMQPYFMYKNSIHKLPVVVG